MVIFVKVKKMKMLLLLLLLLIIVEKLMPNSEGFSLWNLHMALFLPLLDTKKRKV